MGAMMTRQPFTLSVHVHALDRRASASALKRGYRRLFAVNREAERKGRVPDFDRYAQEDEAQQLLAEMAGHERANLFRVSIYQSIRARGPEPDLARAHRGGRLLRRPDRVDVRLPRQPRRVPAARAVAVDAAARPRRRRAHAAATRPATSATRCRWSGTSCGSPTGIPFAFSDPGRTLELLDPYDRTHSNYTMLVNGRSGSGKTMAANVIVSRCIAHGARAFVLDRAGHYDVLTRLVDGRAADRDRRRRQPVRDQPVGRRRPGRRAASRRSPSSSRCTAVMMGDEGLTTLERAQLGAAIRAVYARAAETGEHAARGDAARRAARRAPQEEQGQGAIEVAAVLRNLAERLGEFCGDGSLRLPARPRDHGLAGQPAGRLRHPPLPRGGAAAGDVRDRRVHHARDRAPPRRVPRALGQGRTRRCSPGERCC